MMWKQWVVWCREDSQWRAVRQTYRTSDNHGELCAWQEFIRYNHPPHHHNHTACWWIYLLIKEVSPHRGHLSRPPLLPHTWVIGEDFFDRPMILFNKIYYNKHKLQVACHGCLWPGCSVGRCIAYIHLTFNPRSRWLLRQLDVLNTV